MVPARPEPYRHIWLLALCAASCVPRSDYEAQASKAAQLQQELKKAKARGDALAAQVADLKQSVSDAGKEVSAVQDAKRSLGRKLAATRKELEELAKLRAEADARAKMFKQLTERFRKLISSGSLSVKIVHGRMVLKLRSAVLFPSGKAKLSRRGKRTLASVAKVLAGIDDRHFQVAGHTDNRPVNPEKIDFANNWELSVARAVTVVTFLESHEVNPRNLSAAGFSQYQPVARNRSRRGRRHNRRIEITLLPSIPSQLLRK